MSPCANTGTRSTCRTSSPRLWALFQDYDHWADYAPMVKRVDVLWPGDADHNGRLRRVIYKMPFGREGAALELVHDVEPEVGYTYTMISPEPGQRPDRPVRLEPRRRQPDPSALRGALPPHEGAVALVRGADLRVHQPQNEASMRAASAWLEEHPEYRPDLVEAAAPRA